MKVYKELENGFYLFGDSPLAVLSENKNGCVALAFETESYAHAFIKEQIQALASRDVETPEIKAIGNCFTFMQLCAKHGLAGIELLSEENQKSFIFCVRLEEVSSMLPTALSFNLEGVSYVKTRFKEYSENTYRTIKEWQRYDILDKVSASFAVNSPFRGWESDDLFEIRPTSKMLGNKVYSEFEDRQPSHITLFNVPCLGHFNAIDGSVPFFTSIKLAFDFLYNRSFTSHIMGFFGTDFVSEFNEIEIDKAQLNDYFKIVKIRDIRKRVLEIDNPFKGFCINPNGYRDSTGYITKEKNEVFFHGVSGGWQVLGNNVFEHFNVRKSWDNNDTFYWNGINIYKLKALDRSFSFESERTKYSDLSETDINDLIEARFSEKEDFDEEKIILEDISGPEKLDKYLIMSWDAVTGEGKDTPLYFNSFLDLIEWVWQYETQSDFPMRLNGALQCNGMIGIPESPDPEFQKSLHEKIGYHLKSIYKKVVVKGYSPKIGEDLSAILNHHLKSLHIDCIGYCQDILWQTYNDDLDDFVSRVELPEDLLTKRSSDLYNLLDNEGSKQGKEILGKNVWNKISKRSQFFISSSLSELQILGVSPQLDYSLVSIGFVKALEYELGLVFRHFCLTNDLSQIDYDSNDFGEKILVELSVKRSGKPPTLGSMGHLIKPNLRHKNELRFKLGTYLDGLNCGDYITSKKFWKEGIYKITNKYRNGGAHDSAIPMNTAIECKDYILGNSEVDGVLKKIML
jgi:hypothetical protein